MGCKHSVVSLSITSLRKIYEHSKFLDSINYSKYFKLHCSAVPSPDRLPYVSFLLCFLPCFYLPVLPSSNSSQRMNAESVDRDNTLQSLTSAL